MNAAILIAMAFLLMAVDEVKSDGLSIIPNPILEESEEIAYEKLLALESSMKSGIESLIKRAMPMVIGAGSDANISSECMGSLLKTVFAIRNMDLWAFEMIDSIGIPSGGFLRGLGSAPGTYTQCLNVVIPSSNLKRDSQKGQYCVVRMRFPLPPRAKRLDALGEVFRRINATFKTGLMNELKKAFAVTYDTPFKLGVCIPSACTAEDLNELITLISKQVGINTDVEFCKRNEPYKLDAVQLIIITTYLVFLLMNILGTLMDESVMRKSKEGYTKKIVGAFSIRQNMSGLLTTKQPDKRGLDSMNGMRYISTTWVVLGHAYFLVDRNLLRNPRHMMEIIQDFSFQPIVNGFISVDTFFFITSVLVSYHLVKLYDSGKGFPLLILIVRRILRLLPALLLVASVMVILPSLGSGPFFNEIMEDQAQLCRDKWWHNALFFSNADNLTQMCLPHTWYIATEFQCFLIGLIYFAVLFKCKKLANPALIVAVVLSIASTGLTTYFLEFPPTYLGRNMIDIRFINTYNRNIYMLPHVHLGIYSVGLFLGTFLSRNPKFKLSMITTMVGWPFAIASGMAIVYGTYPFNRNDSFSQVDAVIYSALQRTTWGICLAWVVFACFTQKGGVINTVLSWPGFQPLNRLTYLIYLVHMPIYMFVAASKQGNSDISHYQIIFNFFGVLVTSHILAFFMRVLFQSPVTRLEALLFEWLSSRPKGNGKISQGSTVTLNAAEMKPNGSYIASNPL